METRFSVRWEITLGSRAFLVKLTVAEQPKKLEAFYGTPVFIIASPSWTRWIHSTHPGSSISLRSILTLFSHLRLGLPWILFRQYLEHKAFVIHHCLSSLLVLVRQRTDVYTITAQRSLQLPATYACFACQRSHNGTVRTPGRTILAAMSYQFRAG